MNEVFKQTKKIVLDDNYYLDLTNLKALCWFLMNKGKEKK